jgi:hypothetical protein
MQCPICQGLSAKIFSKKKIFAKSKIYLSSYFCPTCKTSIWFKTEHEQHLKDNFELINELNSKAILEMFQFKDLPKPKQAYACIVCNERAAYGKQCKKPYYWYWHCKKCRCRFFLKTRFAYIMSLL